MNEFQKRVVRKLRNNQTVSEILFWDAVRKRRVNNMRFLRQYPIIFQYNNKERFFIADFYCPEKRLVVEIDGEIHKKQKDYDELRDDLITRLGYNIVRFTNDEVKTDIENILNRLKEVLKKP